MYEAVLFLFLIAIAVVITRTRDLFAAAMLTGISSLLAAGLFTLMDAVDVAFTEAAVGAGISTVLFLGTLSLTATEEYQRKKIRPGPFLVVLLTGAVLIYGTLDMLPYQSPEEAIHQHLAPEYIKAAKKGGDVDMPNIVTGILGSFRGYDTFGETTVVLTAALGVLLLLGGKKGKRQEARE